MSINLSVSKKESKLEQPCSVSMPFPARPHQFKAVIISLFKYSFTISRSADISMFGLSTIAGRSPKFLSDKGADAWDISELSKSTMRTASSRKPLVSFGPVMELKERCLSSGVIGVDPPEFDLARRRRISCTVVGAGRSAPLFSDILFLASTCLLFAPLAQLRQLFLHIGGLQFEITQSTRTSVALSSSHLHHAWAAIMRMSARRQQFYGSFRLIFYMISPPFDPIDI